MAIASDNPSLLTLRGQMNKLLTIAGAAAMFTAVLTSTASPASANAPCGKTGPDLDGRAYVTATTSGANMRSGSSTSCTILASLLAGHTIDYHCFTHANDGYTWSYLRDATTGRYGWVRDDLLPNDGSTFYCGF